MKRYAKDSFKHIGFTWNFNKKNRIYNYFLRKTKFYLNSIKFIKKFLDVNKI